MSSLKIIGAPAAEPLDLATVKSHLRITSTDDDAMIGLYLQAARELLENETHRSLVNKLYRQTHDAFPRRHSNAGYAALGYFYSAPHYAHHRGDMRQELKLLRSPCVNVTKVVYTGTDEIEHTLYPVPASWISGEYIIGDQVSDSNGNLQEVTAVDEAATGGKSSSGSSEPTWNATEGGTTTDGGLTWTNKGTAPDGDFLLDTDSEPSRIHPLYGNIWPATLRIPNAVNVYFTAGYGNDGAAAPANQKVAMLSLVSNWYENREPLTGDNLKVIPYHLQRLIWSESVDDFAPTP